MKKASIFLIIVIMFLIIYFLQANFFSWFNIAGIKPNLFVIAVLIIALFAGIKIGIPTGVILGLFLDLIIGKTIGISSFMFAIVALMGGYLDKNFSKDSKLTIMLMVALCTAVFEIGCYGFKIVNMSISIEILSFLRILIVEVIFNMLLTIIIYPLLQKLGYKLEETFRDNKILTRYF